MNRMLAALAFPARRSRGVLFVMLAVLAARGDAAGPGPQPHLVGLELPDTVHLDGIRDSVRLSAALIYSDGHREPLTVGAWTGNGGDAATLHTDGWVWTRGERAFEASVRFASLSASTVGVVRRPRSHSWGERERAAVRRHYGAARGATVDWSWPEFVADWRPVDPFGITTIDASFLLRTAEGRAEIMTRVRNAISAGQLLDLMFHDVPTEDVDAFRALVSELASVRHRLFTWADLYPVEG
jgi:hypothetical protein